MSKKKESEFLSVLAARFERHPERHEGVAWAVVAARLAKRPEAVRVLAAMEASGGEPDVIGVEAGSGKVVFCDCAAESPAGRRSLCYDREGWASRKEHQPAGNAVDAAAALGVELLDEEQYRALQRVGTFDTKTSSWLRTPAELRALGGALFGDYRYGRVFIYHNGAQSYYAARGFRGRLLV